MDRTKSEHSVLLVNMKELTKDIVSYLIGNGYDLNGFTIQTYAPLGIVTDKNGWHYLINTEGCSEVSDEPLETNKAHINWYKNSLPDDDGNYSIGIMPFVEITMDFDEIMGYTKMASNQRLDEFVRTFGDRLDRNYINWERFLSGVIDKDGNWIKQ